MTTLRIYYHDGSVQVTHPQTDKTKDHSFDGDIGGLASTIARKNHPIDDPISFPNGKLWKRIETI